MECSDSNCWILDIREEVERLVAEINDLPFEPYKPVWRQLRIIVRLVNKILIAARCVLVPMTAVRWRRNIVKAFERANCSKNLSLDVGS